MKSTKLQATVIFKKKIKETKEVYLYLPTELKDMVHNIIFYEYDLLGLLMYDDMVIEYSTNNGLALEYLPEAYIIDTSLRNVYRYKLASDKMTTESRTARARYELYQMDMLDKYRFMAMAMEKFDMPFDIIRKNFPSE